MEKFIGYVRTSTLTQNLGLLEQESQIMNFIKKSNSELVEIIVEQESGKLNERKGLNYALDSCKKNGYTLLFTKLDRITRAVDMLFKIRDEGVKLKCLEIPELNTLTLGIFGTIGQYERELISSRTKNSLNELKRKGVKLGKPENFSKDGREKGRYVMIQNSLSNENWLKTLDVIENYIRKFQIVNYSDIARTLNNKGYKTRRGLSYKPITVKRLIEKFDVLNQI